MKKLFYIIFIFAILISPISCVSGGGSTESVTSTTPDTPDIPDDTPDIVINDDSSDNSDDNSDEDINIVVIKEHRNMLLPLYLEDEDTWNEVINLDMPDLIAVVNPDNGAGYQVSPVYEKVIPDLVASGKLPVGYIPTNYGNRDINDVKDEIDRWLELYPDIKGFFLDEVSDKSSEFPYYEEITNYIKSLGDFYIVLNVGTYPAEEYFSIADNIVVYEDLYPFDYTVCDNHPDQSSIIVYGVNESLMYEIIKNTKCKYVFITDDNLPNPYDSLPTYLNTEIELLKNSYIE